MASKAKGLIGILIIGVVLSGRWAIGGYNQISEKKEGIVSRAMNKEVLKRDVIIKKITGGGDMLLCWKSKKQRISAYIIVG
jgi:hypothetical protein